MPDRSRKRPKDPNQLAKSIVDVATGQVEDSHSTLKSGKNPAAVALGRSEGSRGAKREPQHYRRGGARKLLAEPQKPGGRPMTTEIAVANKLGISLASDSAVTITSGGRIKIFNTADKLFELSAVHPVGVMINGNMDCLGVPWEILVKEFRESEGIRKRAKITDWTTDFVTFVQSHALIGDDTSKRYIHHVIGKEIETIQEAVSSNLLERFQSRKPKTRQEADATISELILEEIKYRLDVLKEFPVADSLNVMTPQQICERYADEIDSLAKARFKPVDLSQESLKGIREISADLFGGPFLQILSPA